MQVSKILVALTVAAGFASASFAQGAATPAPQTAPAAKVTAPASVAVEKKVEALKAGEPAKVEAAKTEAPKADAGKPVEKHAKHKAEKHEKHEKVEAKAESKPAAPAPTSK